MGSKDEVKKSCGLMSIEFLGSKSRERILREGNRLRNRAVPSVSGLAMLGWRGFNNPGARWQPSIEFIAVHANHDSNPFITSANDLGCGTVFCASHRCSIWYHWRFYRDIFAELGIL